MKIERFEDIIDSLVYEEDFLEEIKLKLIHCISDKNNNEWQYTGI